MDLEIPFTAIEDIGKLVAKAIVDERTINKAFQIDFNFHTQNQLLALVDKYWGNQPFKFLYYSTPYIKYMMGHSDSKISAKKGNETDEQRWGINNAIYVLGKMATFDDNTTRASKLYPDFEPKKVEDAIKDPKFMFESGEPFKV